MNELVKSLLSIISQLNDDNNKLRVSSNNDRKLIDRINELDKIISNERIERDAQLKNAFDLMKKAITKRSKYHKDYIELINK